MGEKRKNSSDNEDGLNSHRSWKKLDRKLDLIIKNDKSINSFDNNLSNKGCPLSQDDVIFFQKQAIYRMFHLQYNKNLLLLDNLNLIKNNYSKLLIYNSILIQWWFQILNNLKSLFNLNSSDSIINDDILLSLSNLDYKLNSKDDLISNLNLLRDGLIKLFNSILNNNTPNPNIDIDKILNLENKISSLSVINNKLTNEINLLKSLNSNLNSKIENLIRLNDRSNSKSLDRIKDDSLDIIENKKNIPINNTDNITSNETIIKSEKINDSKTNLKTALKNQSDSKLSSSSLLSSSSPSSSLTSPSSHSLLEISKSEIEELNLKILELSGKNEVLQSQLNEKIKINSDFEKKINELNSKLINLSNDDLIKYSLNYRNLIKENENLNKLINDLQISKKKLESQMFELESKFSINKNKIEEKLNNELLNNTNHISKLENDLNRIRSDRDSLNSKLNILSKEKGKNELIDNFNKIIPTLKKRIDELEELKNLNFEKLSNDENNKIIINELKQIEEAFKSIKEVSISKLISSSESEILINKLSIEKSKADEKYFQAMRIKDSLSSQNKILSSNLTKQMELIEILKNNEKELQIKLNIEEKLYENLQKIENLYKNDISKLQLKIKNLEKSSIEKLEIENDLRSQISKYQFELQQFDKKLILCQQDLNSQNKKNEHYKSIISSLKEGKSNNSTTTTNNNNINNKTEEDSEIQEALLSMTKCSLCGKNFKNVALKTCGHTFCKDCVDDRLSARMRKCPNCNQQFSRYDLLTIHL
ncbi:hypothetical protein C6P40_004037 [Pichia californica]|uniref:E3 ubiquitin protein ligase n=1 Tax=Pichia californica TaxID=460514 RepID=A0A9P6WQH4_9ASCO|nr:hypothetical protein C6P42_002423 [[Candida] californica]KAG0691225.1 hypothetical protein C6P40_004037 [[Candida] californica]